MASDTPRAGETWSEDEEEVWVICPTCNGSGVGMCGPVETSRCSACGGSGEVPGVGPLS
jgi:DnaJ-class molecular chaperone